jgi:hypothetical protein
MERWSDVQIKKQRQRDRETERHSATAVHGGTVYNETKRKRDRYSATAIHGGQYTMRQREREIEIDYEVVHESTDWSGRL